MEERYVFKRLYAYPKLFVIWCIAYVVLALLNLFIIVTLGEGISFIAAFLFLVPFYFFNKLKATIVLNKDYIELTIPKYISFFKFHYIIEEIKWEDILSFQERKFLGMFILHTKRGSYSFLHQLSRKKRKALAKLINERLQIQNK